MMASLPSYFLWSAENPVSVLTITQHRIYYLLVKPKAGQVVAVGYFFVRKRPFVCLCLVRTRHKLGRRHAVALLRMRLFVVEWA